MMTNDEQPPDKVNPFAAAAAIGAGAEALRKLEWEIRQKKWEAHLAACEVIMRTGILTRLELAADALRSWGYDAATVGVVRRESFTGRIFLRVSLETKKGTPGAGELAFIASPKSMVMAIEGFRSYERRRWAKIALTAEGVSGHADIVIADFLKWV